MEAATWIEPCLWEGMALLSPDPFTQEPLRNSSTSSTDSATDPLWDAARDADGSPPNPGDPADLWTEVMAGRLRPYSDRLGPSRCYSILRSMGRASGICYPLSAAESTVLLRVLCGDQQKVISTELDIAHSTASKRCAQALDKLELTARTIPLPVVVAAQRAAGVVTAADIRQAAFTYQGCEFVVASIPRPKMPGRTPLTTSEQSIAQLLVEGRSRWQIAEARNTSVQTVSCQLRSIFAKFQATGRYGLTRRAAELGWFDGV
jgi:DNA-binding NarL/FixJ family response regulator